MDGEDTFTAMLAHLLRASGLEVSVRRYDEPGLREVVRAHRGPVVLGPGPGDPGDLTDPKMRLLREITAELVRDHRHGLLGVCLGHELIAAELGLEIVRKAVPYQGAQTRIELFGRPETVGFYNSFTGRCDGPAAVELAAHGIEVSRDEDKLRAARAARSRFRLGAVPPGVGADRAGLGDRDGAAGGPAGGAELRGCPPRGHPAASEGRLHVLGTRTFSLVRRAR